MDQHQLFWKYAVISLLLYLKTWLVAQLEKDYDHFIPIWMQFCFIHYDLFMIVYCQ